MNDWPISDEPTTVPSTVDDRAVGLVVERHLADAGDHQWVDPAEQDGEDDHHQDGGKDLASHHLTPSAVTIMSMSLMPTNGAIRPPTP